jgi:PBP1b-binding outer membrane lipoprotein LpoB
MALRVGRRAWLTAIALLLVSAGAAEAQRNKAYDRGQKAQELDPSTRGPISGVGIESQDIIGMTDRMMRDMLSNPQLAGRQVAPRIIVDDQYFTNESSQRLNKRIITDRLRVNLNRASNGRMVFIGREFASMIAQERELKREGVTDVGTTGLTRAQAGADFRLTGRITSEDSAAQDGTGRIQRFNQITFEMVDLETGVIVWSNLYDFARVAADSVMYR